MMIQTRAQPEPRPVQDHMNIARRKSKCVADLFCLQFNDFAHHEHTPLLRRQPVEACIKDCEKLSAMNCSLRILPARGARGVAPHAFAVENWRQDVLVILAADLAGVEGALLPMPQYVGHFILQNRDDPGFERRFRSEAVCILQRSGHGLLDSVFGFIVIAKLKAGKAQHVTSDGCQKYLVQSESI